MKEIRGFGGVILGLACACVTGFGCDAQASTGYDGEALLTLSGSVELTQSHPEGPLVPALLFPKGGSYFDLVEVDVKGEFPSGFQINVYEPPPTIPEVDPEIGDPPAVIGYISAVQKKHPDIIRYATQGSVGYESCNAPDCESDCKAIKPCLREGSWCSSDNECYTENWTCAEYDTPIEECTIDSMSGDPTLKDPFTAFAGFSTNFVVLYLTAHVSERSVTARTFNAPHGLDAGYHLIGIRAETDEERAQRRDCNQRATQRAIDAENRPRGTSYEYDDVIDYACQDQIDACMQEGSICEPMPTVVSKLCGLPEKQIDAIQEAVEAATMPAKLELGCRLRKDVATYIEDPAKERVTVELTTESSPFGPIVQNQVGF